MPFQQNFLKVCVISQRKSIHTYAMRKRTKIQGHPNRMFCTSIIGFCLLKWMPQWLIYIRKIVLYCTSTSFVNALLPKDLRLYLFSEIHPEFGILAQMKVNKWTVRTFRTCFMVINSWQCARLTLSLVLNPLRPRSLSWDPSYRA